MLIFFLGVTLVERQTTQDPYMKENADKGWFLWDVGVVEIEDDSHLNIGIIGFDPHWIGIYSFLIWK